MRAPGPFDPGRRAAGQPVLRTLPFWLEMEALTHAGQLYGADLPEPARARWPASCSCTILSPRTQEAAMVVAARRRADHRRHQSPE